MTERCIASPSKTANWCGSSRRTARCMRPRQSRAGSPISQDATECCAETGKELWTFATRSRVESSPAIVDGRVYIGSNDGRFYVLDAANGAKLWEFTAGAPLSASPAIAQGRIVIGSQDGKLYCFGA